MSADFDDQNLESTVEGTAGLSIYEIEHLLELMKKVLRTESKRPTHLPDIGDRFPNTLAVEEDLACTLFYYICHRGQIPKLLSSGWTGGIDDELRAKFSPEKLYALEE